MMDNAQLDENRRRLLSSVLAGGALYAFPMIATLSSATGASAQDASKEPRGKSDSAPGGKPDGSPGGRPVDSSNQETMLDPSGSGFIAGVGKGFG